MINLKDLYKRPTLEWWGYKHISGTYHVKRYFSSLDITEAQESGFVSRIARPFLAENREKALVMVRALTDINK